MNFYHKKRYFNIFSTLSSVILLIFTLSSCTPHILRLNVKPTQNFRDWQGKEITSLEKDSVKMTVFFDQKSYSSSHFAFHFSFANLSSKDIIIQPDTFYYKTEGTNKQVLMAQSGYLYSLSEASPNYLPPFAVKAMSPESIRTNLIIKQQTELSKMGNLEKPAKIINPNGKVLKRQLTKKIIKKTTSRQVRKQNKNTLQNAIKQNAYYQAINENNRQKQADKTGFVVENMRDAPLQKTMLGQSGSISGRVWFQFLPEYNLNLKLVVVVNGISFEIPYIQTTIRGEKKQKYNFD